MIELVILVAAALLIAGFSCLGVIWYRSQQRVRERLRRIDDAVQEARTWSLQGEQRLEWVVRSIQDVSRKADAILVELQSSESDTLRTSGTRADAKPRSVSSIGSPPPATLAYPLQASSSMSGGDGITERYNAAALGNDDARTSFFDAYRPIRLAVANAVERVKDPNEPPQFVERSDGEYLATRISPSGNRYAVVPRFDLTPEETILGPGAMAQIFDCRGYDRRARSSRFAVMRPAIFDRDGVGWSLRDQGILSFSA